VKSLSVLVVDDEWPARNFLVELLRDTGEIGQIIAVTDVAEAREALTHPDLGIEAAFVDIRLVDRPGDRSGLDFARTLMRLPEPLAVVLATASTEYALDGFELGAIDYLLKPFTLERVRTSVARLLVRRRRPPARPDPPRLVARAQQRLVFLDLDGMLAFQAVDRLTELHHVDGRFAVDLSLTALASALGDAVLRVHRNWLIAPRHVRGLVRECGEWVLDIGTGLRVPVARERAREVRARLLEHAIGIAQSDPSSNTNVASSTANDSPSKTS